MPNQILTFILLIILVMTKSKCKLYAPNAYLFWRLFKAGHVRSGYLLWRSPKQDSFKLVCYMTNWAQYRPNGTKFVPSDLDPFLCTHYIYAFASINASTYEIKSFEWNDESHEKFKGFFVNFLGLSFFVIIIILRSLWRV